MKHYLFIFLVTISYTSIAEQLTVRQQLENVNRCWKSKPDDAALLKQHSFKSDVELIQLHLLLVEKNLSNAPATGLTAIQLANRSECLDILHAYWTKGVFPINLYHAKRTPYFIDHVGTACAVGQLI